MKKTFECLKRFPVLIVLLIIAVFFMPSSLAKPLETVRNAVVTAIGIDYENSEYEVSLISFLPTPTKDYIETYNINSVKASTMSDVMVKAGMHLGKNVTLFHTEVAVLGNSLLQNDVSKALDYLSREESLSNSCILIATNSSAKEMLKFLQENESNPSERIRELMHYNAQHVNCENSSVESFYKGFYSPVKTSFMPYLELKSNKNDDGVMLNNSAGSKQSSQINQSEEKKELKNEGKVVIFKNGKRVDVFSPEVMQGMNFLKYKKTQDNIVLENFSDGELTNAKVVYFLNKKKIIKIPSFENGVPVMNYAIKLYLDRVEMYKDRNELQRTIQLNNINEKSKLEIESKVKKEISKAIEKLRENKSDLIEVYSNFYLKKRKDFVSFLKNLDDKDDFLSFVVFNFNIEVEAD